MRDKVDEFRAGTVSREFKDGNPTGWKARVIYPDGNHYLEIMADEPTVVRLAAEAVASALNKVMR